MDSDGDSTDLFEQWYAEHARNPDTDMSPRSAAAAEAGRALFVRQCAELGIEAIHDSHVATVMKLTKTPDGLPAFGERLAEAVDLDDAPTRLELQREMIDEGELEEGELAPTSLGEERFRIALDALGEEAIAEFANQVVEEESNQR